ncbi:hypothetical protein C5D98_14990 [Rathayibacter rathayi]|uniref:conjugal transfer protein n=1 Tax=Rathayibacter rathayi TaxID=33887 RepID=UPI000CE90535|nr:conjugal transfer protein [Rathayibacter rathayi]PPG77487.1 hypothetical protein C5C15_09335 [Rathayibacter rathayi]PPG94323.1 hypothetical protein C5C22_09070 [Rathayibacter rathayi]PPI65255.1 hypothetical protein C5D98_14990 [Rathayibacter rathayi]
MNLFKKKTDEELASSKAPVAETARWTGGSVWAFRGATVGLWGLLLVWPVAIALVVPGPGTVSNAAPNQVNAVRDTSEQSAGAVASGFVAAWLSATKNDSTELQRYVSTAGMDLPDKGWAFRNLSIASVGEATSNGFVPVQIAANVEETSIHADAPVTSWRQRYFAVTVQVSDGALGVVGMPAPITGPAAPTKQPDLDYSANIGSNSPVAATASSFLAAYLTGNGEVSRYVTPEVEIFVIEPAPYSAVKVKDVSANAAPAEKPADGDVLNVLVKSELVSGTGQTISAHYVLTMTARADRWEVTSIDPTPTGKPTTPK